MPARIANQLKFDKLCQIFHPPGQLSAHKITKLESSQTLSSLTFPGLPLSTEILEAFLLWRQDYEMPTPGRLGWLLHWEHFAQGGESCTFSLGLCCSVVVAVVFQVLAQLFLGSHY